MNCKKCKKEIPTGSIFCLWCGATQVEATSFEEVALLWEAEHFPTLAANTLKGYTPALRRAIIHFGADSIQDISPQQINLYIKKLVYQKLALKTVKTHLLILSLIFKFAVIEGYIDNNPVECIKIPKNLPRSRRNPASDEDIQKIKANTGHPFALFALLVLYTGCRRGEAFALKYEKIDKVNKTILIDSSVYHINNIPFIKTPKTDAGIRSVPLLDPLLEIIPDGDPEEYIFQDPVLGGLMRSSAFSSIWKQYCQDIGISITPHQLRHSYATILFEAGIDEKDAQEFMGHSSIALTKDTYTHIRQSRREKSAEKINQYLASEQFLSV